VCFDGGWPGAIHRVLRNSTLSAWEAAGSPAAGARPGEGEILGYNGAGDEIERYSDAAPRIGFTGAVEAMCLYSGLSVDAINNIPTVAELMRQLQCELILNEEHPA
jgi:nitronate monooxygenase